MTLCKYSEKGGIPGEGVHKYQIFNIAIFDLGLTIIAALIFAYLLHKSFDMSFLAFFIIILLILFLLGILAHRFFCVRTTIDKLLFTN